MGVILWGISLSEKCLRLLLLTYFHVMERYIVSSIMLFH